MKQNNNLTQQTVSGVIWKFAERIGAQVVTLIVSIILARILLPEDYGIVAIVTIFITICNVFVSNGFGSALIQKKNADDIDFSSVFYASIVISLALYVIVFFTAPFIADFYGNELLKPVLQVMGLRVPVAAINSVQQAYVSRKMEFKKFFFATLVGTIVSGAVGIWMAYNGYGIWSLVAQYLINVVMGTLVLGIVIKWLPKPVFSFKRLGVLLSYGWKLLLSGLLDTGYNELRSLVIGKKYSSSDLAYYDQGKKYPSFVAVNLSSAFSSVLFSAMSKVQDDREKVKQATRKSIKISAYLMMPLMMGLACVAEPFVKAVLTDKWLPMVPYLQMMCFVYAFYPIHTANLTAIQAVGRSDLFLILEIIKKSVGIISLVISMWFGVFWIAATMMITTLISSFINAFPNKKLLGYSYWEQVKDLLPALGLSVMMGVPVYLMSYISLAPIVVLVLQILTGIIIYVVASALFKVESFYFILNFVKKLFKKKEDIKMEKKKILLLGGSAQQVVAIKTAKELGYYTILCDYLSDNPGQYVADKFYLVSTTDKEKVLDVAKREKVEGVLAYASDPAAPTAAYVAEKMGLPTNPVNSVNILCEKHLFREFLLNNNFNVPNSLNFNVKSFSGKHKEFVRKMHFPLLVKPVDSSGSKGISKIFSIEELKPSIEFAEKFSRNKIIEVEEFLVKDHKYLVGGDIFVVEGKVVFWGLLNCYRDITVNELVPVGKSYPLFMPENRVLLIHKEIQRLISSLHIKFGAFNVELLITENDKLYFIELGPRNGGNMIPNLLSCISGKDMIKASVEYAMGNSADIVFSKKDVFYASYNLHVNKDGIFKGIKFLPEIDKHIIKKEIYLKENQRVYYFDSANKALGIIFLKFDSLEEMMNIMDNCEKLIKIVVE